MYIVLLALLFVILLAAPLVFAALYYKRRRGRVLYIDQKRSKEARYFGKSFAYIVKRGLQSASNSHIVLSKEEPYINADTAVDYPDEVENMVISRTEVFCPPPEVKEFSKEIYCENDAVIKRAGLKLRAVYSKKRVILGDDVVISRWVDAEETVAVYKGCDLGISATAGERLSLGTGCRFHRLYAPEICIGQEPGALVRAEDGKDPRTYWLPCLNQEEYVRHGFNSDMVSDDGIVPYTIISAAAVKITDGVIVQGDLRSHEGVRLCDNVVVCGNVFAEGGVRIGRNSVVLGNVFSQESIWLEENAVVGRRGETRSVIARKNITFEKNTTVFGYVSCEHEGRVRTSNDAKKDEIRNYIFLDAPEELRHLKFESLWQYENSGDMGFRHKNALETAVLPEAAEAVPASFFFDCPHLTCVTFSPSIRKIGDYAFADCAELKDVTGVENTRVEAVGASAFENCGELTQLKFPNCVTALGGAAFGGCAKLKSVTFSEHSLLQSVGDHCFRGCESIEELYLPDMLSHVGVSAFKDCSHLKHVSLPALCAGQPGIEELRERGVELTLRREAVQNEAKNA